MPTTRTWRPVEATGGNMKVLAQIPQDNGKQIRFSHTDVMTVEHELCHLCDAQGAVVVKGETDSFGFEPMVLCADCAANSERSSEEFFEALDIEDRAPLPGHAFLVCECTNHDGHGDWCMTFVSYRAAVAFHRRIEDKAAPWCGLYPDKGVREVPEADAARAQEAHRRELEEAWALAGYGDDLDDDLDDDYGDDDLDDDYGDGDYDDGDYGDDFGDDEE